MRARPKRNRKTAGVPRKKSAAREQHRGQAKFRLGDSASWGNLLLGGGFGCGVGVLLGEALDAAGGVHKLLLAGEEGMAVGADFHVQPVALDGGTRLKIIPASTVNGYGMIVGMNTGLHESPVCRVRSARLICAEQTPAASLGREEPLIITAAFRESKIAPARIAAGSLDFSSECR